MMAADALRSPRLRQQIRFLAQPGQGDGDVPVAGALSRLAGGGRGRVDGPREGARAGQGLAIYMNDQLAAGILWRIDRAEQQRRVIEPVRQRAGEEALEVIAAAGGPARRDPGRSD